MAITLDGTNGITTPDVIATSQSSNFVTTGNISAADLTLTGAASATDLTLSGGVYLGGTGAANYLDDYEEGTWTPVIAGQLGGAKTPSASSYGWYVKVGGYVTVGGTIGWSGGDASLSGNILITGLPFNSSSASGNLRSAGTLSTIAPGSLTATGGYTWFSTVIDAGCAFAYIIENSASSYSHTPSVAASGAIYGFTLTYRTA